mmetsp:Transcript_19304/g.32297  ORF Transcript_19304/g.32297 Transcript_19304/m.32297 type:complete len:1139 (-) Transcript_19304:598-4014(-)|eukprot:CAMPEP_0203759274 /NCGR_PEP_ID=MMETSP0098-20131031/12218_1 /ASSEMBLY_ACC=CAM_ASM_000208 /TAXON_ID=96639 /ORGANISM=" , Strain NY0313808BC1" /LENGTH=1138 /DNA_ID=CAMNT_0050652093 /DNA_START=279 /DNA_END=3695 /DNA_ORIENTATION=-
MVEDEVKGLEDDAYAMDRYSRQIGAYGVEAMAKLVKMKVLIVGLTGTGIETAKNLVLAGPGGVTIMDDTLVEMQHLGCNFYLRECDVGKKTRAEACVPHLQALNRLVDIRAATGPVTEGILQSHTAAVFCGVARDEAIKWNKFCRENDIGFFMCGVRGLFGYCFADLGDNFTVRDKNGEQPITRIIDGIEVGDTEANTIVVHLIPPPDGRRHNIEDNEHEGWVTFDEVQGELGSCLNGKGPFRVSHVYNERVDEKTGKTKKVFNAYALQVKIDGVDKLPKFGGGGGMMTQVKVPQRMPFRSLEACIDQPISPGDYGLLFTDGAKFGRAEQLHVALQGLWDFESKNDNKPPRINNEEDIEAVIRCATERNARLLKANEAVMDDCDHPKYLALEQVEDPVVKMTAQHAACEFQPLTTFFGGVLAQEVVKMTGKFTPLHQWMHIDCFEVLPEMFVDEKNPDRFVVTAEDRKPIGSRYDDLIAIFGRKFQQELAKKSTFMVGCGALGCELLKNLALLGVACSEDGSGLVTVTDNDTIEVSNLSRQFLFRETNVGQPKSAAASAAAIEMNPRFHVKALQQFVGPNTESIFNAAFWESQDFVTNALDNVKARLYVDGQCVFYGKPLLESGTLGTKCNVQVVLPNLTQSYADGPKDDDASDAIPMCTLRNFPSQIEHCIEWSRAKFTDMFTTAATEATNFCAHPEEWLDECRKKTLELGNRAKVMSAVDNELPPLRSMMLVINHARSPDNCFAECVKEAYDLFHKMFRDNILSLVSTYPEDATDKNGDLFWSGTKRFPQAPKFDTENQGHMNFLISTANILAVNYGLQPAEQPLPEDHPWRSFAHVKKIVSKLSPPAIVKEKVDMSGGGEDDAANENEMELDEDASLNEFKSILNELEAIKNVGELKIEAADFEKDADWNFHIDFITAASNLRAWNYRLKEVSRHKCKMIAGKIIPALATTTAAVTGLVMIEMIKAIQPGKQLEAFKDSSNSLGINGYFFSEPSPPTKAKDEYDPIEMSEVKCKPPGFTKWDKTWVKKGSLTLGQFLDTFSDITGFNCTTLYHNSADREGTQGHSKFIYESSAWKKEMKKMYEERKEKTLEDITFDLYGEDAITSGQKYVLLEVGCEDSDGNPWKVPAVVYYFSE